MHYYLVVWGWPRYSRDTWEYVWPTFNVFAVASFAVIAAAACAGVYSLAVGTILMSC